jgi:hypothetical protein
VHTAEAPRQTHTIAYRSVAALAAQDEPRALGYKSRLVWLSRGRPAVPMRRLSPGDCTIDHGELRQVQHRHRLRLARLVGRRRIWRPKRAGHDNDIGAALIVWGSSLSTRDR